MWKYWKLLQYFHTHQSLNPDHQIQFHVKALCSLGIVLENVELISLVRVISDIARRHSVFHLVTDDKKMKSAILEDIPLLYSASHLLGLPCVRVQNQDQEPAIIPRAPQNILESPEVHLKYLAISIHFDSFPAKFC